MIVKITMSFGISISNILEIWTSEDNINWIQWGTATKAELIQGVLLVSSSYSYYKVVDPGPGPCAGLTKIFSCAACNDPVEYPGGVSYPTTVEQELGYSQGWVSLDANSYTVPDRFIVYFDGSPVIDSGYIGSSSYDIGGSARATFTTRTGGLINKIDPILLTTYPDIINFPDDGYPRVSSFSSGRYPGEQSFYFNKTSSTTSATVKVYAPLISTLWEFTLSCPGVTPP